MKVCGKGSTWRDEGLQGENKTPAILNENTDVFIDNKDGLKVWYTNADGFINKRSELLLLLSNADEKPNVIVITEVKP